MQTVIGKEQQDIVELERHRFKTALIAAHPEHAETIMNDTAKEEQQMDPETGLPFTVEEITDMTRVTNDILEQIRESGFAVEDM